MPNELMQNFDSKARKRVPVIGADRLFGQPWFISKSALRVMTDAWLVSAKNAPAASYYDDDDDDDDNDPPYRLTADGIAQIQISGPLTKNIYWRTTAYSEIAQICNHAISNEAVNAILLCFDSPGGEVSGMFDVADYLYGLRGQKPIAAISSDMCYSAAYALGSCADKLFVTRTGGTGSIGCWQAHVDYSEMLKEAGVKVTLIAAGARKVDGNPYEPLSDTAREQMKDGVDRIREMFVQLVARNRAVSADALMATEAACFMSEDGVPLLADAVGTMDDALEYLRSRIASASEDKGDDLGDVGLNAGESKPSASYVLPASFDAAAVTGLYARGGGEIEFGAAIGESLFANIGHKGPAILAVRNFPDQRSAVSGEKGSERNITMLVVPYDGSLSTNLGGFREVYQRGCFSQGLDSDPRVLFNHDESCILGRTSAGTCRLWEDQAGVHADATAPATTWADDLLVSMRRGDINQASAAFWILQHRWEQRGAERVRVVEKALMREASVHAFAAYETTTAVVKPAASATESLASVEPALENTPHAAHELDEARLRLLSLR